MKTAEKKVRARSQKALRVAQAYNDVFRTPQGQLVLEDMMETHHMLRSTLHKSVKEMVFNEGERNVILRILRLINTNPAYMRERIEQYERDLSAMAED